MKTITTILFIGMCVAQLAIPFKMIFESENIIETGTEYKFKTAPIDPTDPFRGKYITLAYEANFIRDTAAWDTGEAVNITFADDSAGFAVASGISREIPEGPYLHTTISYTSSGEPPYVYFNLPFDRFYLEESKASEAEFQYREANRDSAQVAFGVVKIGKGQAVLTDVKLNEKSVSDLLNQLNQQQ